MTRKEERAHSHRTMMTMMIRYERLEEEGRFAEYLRRLMTRKEEWAHSHRTMMTMMIRYERLEVEGRFAEYLRRLMARKEERAHSHRTVLHHTNNYVESAFRILKDTVLERTRAYNVGHLLEFLGMRMDRYYTRRFLDAANGRLSNNRAPTHLSARYDTFILVEFIISVQTFHNFVGHISVIAAIIACCTAYLWIVLTPI